MKRRWYIDVWKAGRFVVLGTTELATFEEIRAAVGPWASINPQNGLVQIYCPPPK